MVACGCKNSLWYDAVQPLIRIAAENASSMAMIFFIKVVLIMDVIRISIYKKEPRREDGALKILSCELSKASYHRGNRDNFA